MKKLVSPIALACFLFFLSNNAKAQTEDYEAGLRFANNYGNINSIAIDFAMPLSDNRLHANARFFNQGFGVAGFYDWQFPFAEGFFFYPGVGAGFSLNGNGNGGIDVGIAIGGEAGVEYQFPFPLTLGCDYEPMFNLISSSVYAGGWGINARWRF